MFKYPTGRPGAEALGYDPATIQAAPPELLDSFCGVGNPFSLGPVGPGLRVLDFGCGGGFDLFVAASLVGSDGSVSGIDLTPEMAARARRNLARAGLDQVEIQHVESERIPYDDGSFDLVISNGVINLSPCKQTCFKEILRVLRPAGRLQFADVVLEKELPQAMSASPEAWSQ